MNRIANIVTLMTDAQTQAQQQTKDGLATRVVRDVCGNDGWPDRDLVLTAEQRPFDEHLMSHLNHVKEGIRALRSFIGSRRDLSDSDRSEMVHASLECSELAMALEDLSETLALSGSKEFTDAVVAEVQAHLGASDE